MNHMPMNLSLRISQSALFGLLLAATAAAQPGRVNPWPKSGLEIREVVPVSGVSVPARAIIFDTPADLGDTVSPDYPYRYSTLSGAQSVPFEQMRKIIVAPTVEEWISSSAEQIEYYDLGAAGRAVPPPPDWQRSFGNQPSWKSASAVRPGVLVPYINAAEYFWSKGGDGEKPPASELLFRQKFELRSAGPILRATLRLAGRADFLSAAINDHPVHLGGEDSISIGEFEVTPLIRPGTNLIAIWARPPRSAKSARVEQPAAAFHLQILRCDDGAENAGEGPEQGSALLLGKEGERIWGKITHLDDNGIHLTTSYGDHELEWEKTAGILFPDGWTPLSGGERKGMLARMRRWWDERGKDNLLNPHGQGLPLHLIPGPLEGNILLTGGRSSEAHAVSYSGEKVELMGENAQRYSVRSEEILAIYPPAERTALNKPKADVAPYFCKVKTTHGESIPGLLRQANRKGIVLDGGSGGFLEIAAKHIVQIEFPFHPAADSVPPHAAQAKIGVLGRAGGLEDVSKDFEDLNTQFQQAAFLAGEDCLPLPQPLLLDPDHLTPESFPLIASIDPVGEYPDTINTEGDVRENLTHYVESGGTLLVFSRGGGIRTAVISHTGEFSREDATDRLPSRLRLKTFHPGDTPPSGIRPFDRPPNQAERLVFQRTGNAGAEIQGLPEKIAVGPMALSPFYPMASPSGDADVIYELRVENGIEFGPGMSVFRRGKGRVVVIDHLLWNAAVEDDPFSTMVLPAIIRWGVRLER